MKLSLKKFKAFKSILLNKYFPYLFITFQEECIKFDGYWVEKLVEAF
jgi:hypothetical protein